MLCVGKLCVGRLRVFSMAAIHRISIGRNAADTLCRSLFIIFDFRSALWVDHMFTIMCVLINKILYLCLFVHLANRDVCTIIVYIYSGSER